MPTMSIKELLEDYFLIPRKIRHFLRTKKHVLVNDQTINWQSKIQAGDLLSLTFDEEDYPAKAILMGKPELVQDVYKRQVSESTNLSATVGTFESTVYLKVLVKLAKSS